VSGAGWWTLSRIVFVRRQLAFEFRDIFRAVKIATQGAG